MTDANSTAVPAVTARSCVPPAVRGVALGGARCERQPLDSPYGRAGALLRGGTLRALLIRPGSTSIGTGGVS